MMLMRNEHASRAIEIGRIGTEIGRIAIEIGRIGVEIGRIGVEIGRSGWLKRGKTVIF